jgi:hypothetical protein
VDLIDRGRVPDREDAAVFVVAQDAEGRDVEVQSCRRVDLQLHPGDRNRTQEMAVREREDAAVGGDGEGDEINCSRIDLCR